MNMGKKEEDNNKYIWCRDLANNSYTVPWIALRGKHSMFFNGMPLSFVSWWHKALSTIVCSIPIIKKLLLILILNFILHDLLWLENKDQIENNIFSKKTFLWFNTN